MEQSDMKNAKDIDWREPLYACACGHRREGDAQKLSMAASEFAFLGKYRDAPAQRELCLEEYHRLREKTLQEAGKAGNLRDAVKLRNQLQIFEADTECIEAAAHMEEKIKKYYRRETLLRRAGITAAFLAGAALLAGTGLYLAAL